MIYIEITREAWNDDKIDSIIWIQRKCNHADAIT